MSAPRDTLLPPSSAEPSPSQEVSSTPNSPTYTTSELAAIFLDFYKFLATLHYDLADLKIPPPEGWPGLKPDGAGYKSAYAVEVLRHLPYLSGKADVHYKSALIDYSGFDNETLTSESWRQSEHMLDFYCENENVHASDLIFISIGHESGGREILLHVQQGVIIEEAIRIGHIRTDDVKSYFNDLKEEYRSLKLIPCRGIDTIEADGIDDRDESINEEEVLAQTESWGTDLDIQYVRQIYRQHGWPDAYQRDDAEKALDALMEKRDE